MVEKNDEDLDDKLDLTNVNTNDRKKLAKYDMPSAATKDQYRSQQSLGLITQKFMSMRSKNEVMNLNDIAKELQISKRRVYDVINVLEGLGYIAKTEKNQIKWLGEAKTDNQRELEKGVEKLRQQEKLLEHMLRDCQSLIGLHFEDPVSRPYNYIQKSELRRTTALHSKSIVVKPEMDTNCDFEVQVSDPETSDGSRFEMIVRNTNGMKSHALLFAHEDDDDGMDVEREQQMSPTHSDVDSLIRSTADGESEDVKRHIHDDQDDDRDDDGGVIKFEDIETFVLPTCGGDDEAPNARYIPETPGRGIFSPMKTLIDPTCVLPTYSDDSHVYHITPRRHESEDERVEPPSVLDVFKS